jgi:hypothetical protein
MSENASHNKQGHKGYVDFVLSKLDKEGVGVDSQAGEESKVNAHVDDVAKDFTKGTDFTADGYPKGNPEIEHMTQKHSFSHDIDQEEMKTSTLKGSLKMSVDDTAKGHNEKAY